MHVSLQERYPQYHWGKGTYGFPQVRARDDGATLHVGNFTSIATGVQILLGGEHRMDWVTTYPFSVLWKEGKGIPGHPKTKGNVNIGSDVWIGTESMILSGVTIGDGAVVGAKTVVAKDIPPYSVVVGNPGKIIKKRFDDKIINRLLEIKWWFWTDHQIQEAIPFLLSDDINKFHDYAKSNYKLQHYTSSQRNILQGMRYL
jgi:acetyltransferase-like isoleucine patch superfamily enzyme